MLEIFELVLNDYMLCRYDKIYGIAVNYGKVIVRGIIITIYIKDNIEISRDEYKLIRNDIHLVRRLLNINDLVITNISYELHHFKIC